MSSKFVFSGSPLKSVIQSGSGGITSTASSVEVDSIPSDLGAGDVVKVALGAASDWETESGELVHGRIGSIGSGPNGGTEILHLQRGQEGTSAASWSEGDVVRVGVQGREEGTSAALGAPSNTSFTFRSEYMGQPFSGGNGNPCILHRSLFDDGQYRVLVHNYGNTNGDDTKDLYKTSDFESFALISDDWLSSEPVLDNFQDHVVLSDGTIVLAQNDNDQNTITFWTAADGAAFESGNLTEVATPISEPDCGMVYERSTGTIHVYTEDTDNVVGVGSDKLSHFEVDENDLTTATQVADAIDVTNVPWHTGDPDLIRLGDYYYMFTDQTASHPDYRIAVYRSTDLDNWTLIQEAVLNRPGGDLVVTRRDGVLEGFTEYDGDTGLDGDGLVSNVGQWRLYPTAGPSSSVYTDTLVYNDALEIFEGNTQRKIVELLTRESDAQAKPTLRLSRPSSTNSNIGAPIIQLMDAGGNLVGEITIFDGDFVTSAANGKAVEFGVKGTGSVEVEVQTSGRTKFDRQGTNVFNLYDDQGIDIGAQDLSALGSPQDGRIYRHDGSNSISADGGTTSSEGYYVYSSTDSEYKALAQF